MTNAPIADVETQVRDVRRRLSAAQQRVGAAAQRREAAAAAVRVHAQELTAQFGVVSRPEAVALLADLDAKAAAEAEQVALKLAESEGQAV